jgi:IS5 family transposase
VLDHEILLGNPADAPLLAPAVERVIQQTGPVPGAATADPSYGEAAIDEELPTLGVQRVAIPRKGPPSQARLARSTPGASGGWSNGAPGRRGGSVISSTAMAGTGP